MKARQIWAEIIGWFVYKYSLLIFCSQPTYQIDGLVYLEYLKNHKDLGIDDFQSFKREFDKRLEDVKDHPESYAVQKEIPDLF